MKITTEIFQVGGGEYSSPDDAAIYLINFSGAAAVVDAGCGGATDAILGNIQSCNVKPDQVEYLLLTHCHFDHTGGAAALRNILQCQTVAHDLDAKYIENGDDTVTAAKWYGSSIQPCAIDKKLTSSQEEIILGNRTITAIHTPGHSPGSVVYLVESEDQKILFAQDVHGPIIDEILSDRQDYITSLNLLLSLEADILCEGHFGIIRGKLDIANFITSFI